MGISEGSVKVYLSRLFDKLGVKDRYELALFGLRNLTASASQAQPDSASMTALKPGQSAAPLPAEEPRTFYIRKMPPHPAAPAPRPVTNIRNF